MENLPQLFNFDNNELRVIVNESNEIYFIAQDVCQVLGINNVSQALARLDEDEKSTIILNEYGRDYEKPIISESGLYSLVLSSRKSEAKTFKKWVTSEVLPTIRKNGTYSVSKVETTPQTYLEALKALVASEEQKMLLENKVENLQTVLDDLLEWVSIIKVSKHNKVKENAFDWRVLKSKSKELGYAIKKAESPRFGYQNLYHVNVFKACYPQFDYNLK